MKYERFPQRRWQCLQGTHQGDPIRVRTCHVLLALLTQVCHCGTLPPPPAGRQVPGDPAHPHHRIVVGGDPVPACHRTAEGLLNQILCLGQVADIGVQLQRQAVEMRRVQLLEIASCGSPSLSATRLAWHRPGLRVVHVFSYLPLAGGRRRCWCATLPPDGCFVDTPSLTST